MKVETERNPEPRWKRLAKAALLALRGGATRAVSSQITAAQDLIRERRYAEAIEIIEQAMKASPEEAAFLLSLKAGCLSSLGDERGAEEAYEEVLRIDPAHAGAAKMLGRTGTQGSQERRECSVPNGTEDEENPADAARHLLRDELIRKGREAEAAGDNQRLLALLNELIEIERPHATGDFWRAQLAVSYAWRAATHAALGSYEQAIEDCRTCQGIDPTYWKVDPVLELAEKGLNREVAKGQLRHPEQRDSGDPDPRTQEAETWIKDRSTNETWKKPDRNSARTADAGASEDGIWRVGELAFEKIEICEIIAEGGMGTVYCGWDRQNNMPVALKSVKLEGGRYGAVSQEEFRKEAEHWLRLGKHRNIVSLFGVETVDRRHLVLRMEYIAGPPGAGPTLSHRLQSGDTGKRNKLAPPEAARIGVGICEAMDFAHGKAKLVHRDLKPPNVFISASGEVKVGDFGLSIEEGELMGSFAGSPAYAAPEQWEPAARASAASDVYAIGVMLFEMVCGSRPFELPEDRRHAREEVQIATFGELHREKAVPNPKRLNPTLDSEYSSLIRECLAKDPTERPGSFGELRRRLGECAGLQLGPIRTRAQPDPLGAGLEPLLEDRSFEAYGRGVSCDSLGKFEEALSCYREAVEHEPFRTRRSEAWCNMARVLSQMGRKEEAVEKARHALSIDENDHHAQGILAETLIDLGSYDEARQRLELLVKVGPTRVESHLTQGLLLSRMGDFESATRAYGRALEYRSDDPDAFNGLGLCAESTGEPELALEMFAKAIAARLDFAAAHGNRTRVLMAVGGTRRIESALEEARRAAEYQRNNSVYQMNIGNAIAHLGDKERGAEILAHAFELNPRSAEIGFHLAGVLEVMGRTEEALKLGDRALLLAERGGRPEAVRLANAWRRFHGNGRAP